MPQTRWAWATEEPSALERSVAPRLTPTHWWLRCAVLVVICFLLLHLAALFFLVVPLALGRGLSALVYVPKGIRHDPLHFVVGCMVCVSVVNSVLARLPKWEKVKETVAGVRGLPMGLIYHGECDVEVLAFCFFLNLIFIVLVGQACRCLHI